jgi:hypothetical protein
MIKRSVGTARGIFTGRATSIVGEVLVLAVLCTVVLVLFMQH